MSNEIINFNPAIENIYAFLCSVKQNITFYCRNIRKRCQILFFCIWNSSINKENICKKINLTQNIYCFCLSCRKKLQVW